MLKIRKPILTVVMLGLAFGTLEVTKERPEPIKTVTTIRIERPVEPEPLPPIVKTYTVLNERVKASFYVEGKKTANGETYLKDGVTCAHRTLPFHTIVRVTNLDNGKSVECRINDRGPAKWTKKEIDLSRGAAKEIDFIKKGLWVKIEEVKVNG